MYFSESYIEYELLLEAFEDMDPYKEFGISYNATPEEIKKRFRELALKYHPDRNPNNPNAEERFKRIIAAKEKIGQGWTQKDKKERPGAGASYGYNYKDDRRYDSSRDNQYHDDRYYGQPQSKTTLSVEEWIYLLWVTFTVMRIIKPWVAKKINKMKNKYKKRKMMKQQVEQALKKSAKAKKAAKKKEKDFGRAA